MKSVLRKERPEIAAGGFTRYEGAIQFFSRLQSLLQPHFEVLDLGAGRGVFLEDEVPFRRDLRTLKGKVKKVVGADVDQAVLENSGVDEKILITAGAPLPFPDTTFDLIFSDWVLEHVDDPSAFSSEITRVLKSGGWFCARTPNKWGLTAIGARIIPNALHGKLLNQLQPSRQDHDIFPTRYRLNTIGALKKYFPDSAWDHCSYYWRGEPKYFGENVVIFHLMQIWNWFVPPSMSTDVFVFIRKH